MKIFVKYNCGTKSFTLEVENTDSIVSVKQKIQDEINIHPEEFKLI